MLRISSLYFLLLFLASPAVAGQIACPAGTGIKYSSVPLATPISTTLNMGSTFITVADYQLARVCQVVAADRGVAMSCESLSNLSPEAIAFLHSRDCPRFNQ